MNPDTIDWASAWSTVSQAIMDADANNAFALLCFGGFGVFCVLMTVYNVYALRKRGQSPTGAIIGGLAAAAAAGAIGVGGWVSMGSEARAVHATVGACTDIGHGGRSMALSVIEIVGFDATGSWPVDERAESWNVEPSLCDTLTPGSEHILLCATDGRCVGTL